MKKQILVEVLKKACYPPHPEAHKGQSILSKEIFENDDRETNVVISPGATIDLTGNIIIGAWTMIDTGSTIWTHDHFSIRASEKPKLEEAGNLLKDNPDVRVRLEGHTDNIGTEKYNQALSERRARSVREYLNKFYGIVKERAQVIGFGESRPAVPNTTKEMRQKNRRVEFKVQ